MTLETLLPFLVGASLLGCAGLLAFLVGRVTSKKHFLGASLALALALALNLFYGVANHYTGVGINEAALFQIGKGIDGLTRDLLMPLFFLLGMVLVGFGVLLVLRIGVALGEAVLLPSALSMIADAEARGVLAPGGTIIEATAGNTGLGLAQVGIPKAGTTQIGTPQAGIAQISIAQIGTQHVVTPKIGIAQKYIF